MSMLKKIFILLFLTSNIIYPQELAWHHTGGPMGGIIGDMDISSNGDIYAGVYPFIIGYTGLFKSTDNGDSWNKIETQFEDFEVFTVFITKQAHIWVGTDNQGRLYRSTDNGETWENKATGYVTGECWAISESNDGVLFAGDANAGWLYRSTDNGENWVFSANIAPLTFAVDTNNVVYAGTFNGLYSSTNNGITWTHNNFLPNISVSAVLVDSFNNIYCGTGTSYFIGDGLYFSDDGGQNWTQIGFPGEPVLSLAFDSEGSLYAGTLSNGLFKTSDLGQHWYQYQRGIYKKEVYRLIINQQDDIFIGSEGGGEGWNFYSGGGIFRSTNGGDFFEHIGLPISYVKNVVFSGDSLIIAATPSGVQQYNQFTGKWKNLGLHNVEAVTITPSNYLYAATRDEGLFKSTDLGENWFLTNLTIGTLMPVYNVLAVNNDTLFASTDNNLYRSFDGGLNWDALILATSDWRRGLFFTNSILWSIGIISGSAGIYKSTDFGNEFEFSYSGLNNAELNNSICATNNDYVFFAGLSYPHGVVRSTNNGLNWVQVLFNKPVATIFANDSGLVITSSDSIYISTDFGSNWNSSSQPHWIGNLVTEIKQDPKSNFFIGTFKYGLYKVDIITSVEGEPSGILHYSLSQNYPNPFNPSTQIKYTIPQSGFVTLKVYDILGKQVENLVDKYQNAGEYDVTIKAGELASGIYFYRLQAGDYSEVKKMLLLK